MRIDPNTGSSVVALLLPAQRLGPKFAYVDGTFALDSASDNGAFLASNTSAQTILLVQFSLATQVFAISTVSAVDVARTVHSLRYRNGALVAFAAGGVYSLSAAGSLAQLSANPLSATGVKSEAVLVDSSGSLLATYYDVDSRASLFQVTGQAAPSTITRLGPDLLYAHASVSSLKTDVVQGSESGFNFTVTGTGFTSPLRPPLSCAYQGQVVRADFVSSTAVVCKLPAVALGNSVLTNASVAVLAYEAYPLATFFVQVGKESDASKIAFIAAGAGALAVLVAALVIYKFSPKGATPMALVTLVLLCFDAVTDVLFVLSLRDESVKDSSFTPLFWAMVVFILLPVAINLVQLIILLYGLTESGSESRAWIADHQTPAAIVFVLACTNIEALGMLTSQIMGLAALSAPWKKQLEKRIKVMGLAGLFLEDLPQLIIQLVYTTKLGRMTTIAALSVFGSSFGLLFGLIDRLLTCLLMRDDDDGKDVPMRVVAAQNTGAIG